MDLPASTFAPPTGLTVPRRLSVTTFLMFGVVVVAVAISVFLVTTRCPCASKKKQVHFVEPVPLAATAERPFADPPAAALATAESKTSDAHATVFVLDWQGDAAPGNDLAVHFLLTEAPHSTFACSARSIFGAHGRVRVTLPKGGYAARAVFGDGTQAIVDDLPHGGLLTLTETNMRGQVVAEPIAAADVMAGVCARVE